MERSTIAFWWTFCEHRSHYLVNWKSLIVTFLLHFRNHIQYPSSLSHVFKLLIDLSHDLIQAEPSPTTGSFSLHSVVSDTVGSSSLCSPRGTYRSSAHGKGSSGVFEFKPHIRTASRSGLSSLGHLVIIKSLFCLVELIYSAGQCFHFSMSD